jgi:hypothetical protein
MSNDGMLFALADDASAADNRGGRLLVSTDFGQSWTETPLLFPDGTPIEGRIRRVLVSPTFATDATILALVQPHVEDPSFFYTSNIAPVAADLYVSSDAGASWQAYGPPSSHPNPQSSGRDESPDPAAIAISPLYALDGTAVVSLENQGGGAVIICRTYRTTDGGATWVQDDTGDDRHRCGETALASLQHELVLVQPSRDLGWRASVDVPRELTGSFSIHPPFVTRNGALFVGGPRTILELSAQQ